MFSARTILRLWNVISDTMVSLYNFLDTLVESRKIFRGYSMRCGNCGNESPEGSKFCIKCGKELMSSEPARCPHCGAEIVPGTFFCPACGKSIAAPEVEMGGRAYEPLPPISGLRSGSYTSNITIDIILTLITCGIYYFFWQARQFGAVNYLLDQQRYSFWLWFVLALATYGLYNIYYEYYLAQGLVEAQVKHGLQKSKDLPVLSLILAILGLGIVTDAIQQNEINKFFGK